MARFCGYIGFAFDVETAQDVWEPIITQRQYYGDVLSARKRTDGGEGLNDNISLSVRVSIVADPFAETHLSDIVFVVLNGTKWKVTDREVQYPRIVLSVGGIYNEQKD